jgi:NAD+ synthase
MLIKKAGLFLVNLSLPYSVKNDMDDVEKARDIIKPDVFKIHDITEPVNDCNELLSDLPATKVDIGNTKARIRMTILYRVAEVYDLLVAGATNAAELTLGMVTKYGDNASDIQPLGGITKRIVYEMAKIFNAPQSIIDKVSSTGMWDNKSNKDEVIELNHQVCLYLRGLDISEEFELKIVRLYDKSQHKRHSPVRQQDSWWFK